jgi:AcrR family transcriptional regulator
MLVMAYPRQLDEQKILAKAIEIMQAGQDVDLRPLARRLGVKAPSLYRYFRSKKALQKAIAAEGYRRLGDALEAGRQAPSPLVSMAFAYRRFALANPRLYHLMHHPGFEPVEESDVAEEALQPLAVLLKLDRSDPKFIAIFRALRAYVHGFVSLELSGQFTNPQNVEEAFHRGLALFDSSLDRPNLPQKPITS